MGGLQFYEGRCPRARRLRVAGVLICLSLALSCSHPTAPTPTPPPVQTPPPPPVADPPGISCPPSITVGATSSAGAQVTFPQPQVTGGAAPVSVSCSLTSGSTLGVGSTTVECTATDSLNRTASCTFSATVTPAPRISKTKFMAFGDSITAGEVTFPTGAVSPAGVPSFRFVVVPSAAYPTVLGNLLTSRYVLQRQDIAVFNEGLGGELTRNAVNRFLQAYGARRPEVVLLMEGYNDAADRTNGAQSGGALALSTMASEARNRGSRVFIATLAPSRPGNRAMTLAEIVAYNERIRSVARGEGAVLVDVFEALLSGVNIYIGDDGLHPTEIGYRKIAETFFAAIQADLEVR
jgi:lysophospholipase L1-like esterase